MSTMMPRLICDSNLSHAWGRAFLTTIEHRDIAPLIISVDGFKENIPAEDVHIRVALDAALEENGKNSCDVSAMLIFPYKLWKLKGQPHVDPLSEIYLQHYFPRLVARDKQHNGRGTYFERMINFVGVKGRGERSQIETKNQLKHIVEIWRKGLRQSALQVTCFDPAKDHTGSALSAFPCLQQVSFSYDSKGGLAVSAYYPTQFLFDRAYGNYLGLCHLGHFMARELDLKLVRLNCYVGRPEIGRGVTKGKLGDLTRLTRKSLAGEDGF